jgi:hypothetical protein
MDWKKSVGVVVLAGMTVFSLAGCNSNEEATPATETPAPASETTTPTVRQPALPSGNGTMPMPPEGMVHSERQPGPAMDLAAAATALGVTEEELTEALGDNTGGPPDIQAMAEKLSVTEEALREVLGMPDGALPTDASPTGDVNPYAKVQ